jgi:hypothetical protein
MASCGEKIVLSLGRSPSSADGFVQGFVALI